MFLWFLLFSNPINLNFNVKQNFISFLCLTVLYLAVMMLRLLSVFSEFLFFS